MPVSIPIDDARSVGGLLIVPDDAVACYVMAHGAGAGMAHPFMNAFADRPCRIAHRDAALSVPVHGARVEAARMRPRTRTLPSGPRWPTRTQACPGVPLVRRRQVVRRTHDVAGAGDRAAARRARPRIRRVPAASARASPPTSARVISTTCAFRCCSSPGRATSSHSSHLLEPVIERLAPRATLHLVDDADHGLHVPARSGRKDAEVRAQAAATAASWMGAVIMGMLNQDW